MGARGKKTVTLKEKSQPSWTVNCSITARNLRKGDLGGVIFGCKHNTIEECSFKQLFGLPATHFSYVRNVEPGLPLFLFNYSDRKLHGIFEAASTGQMNINPHGWLSEGSEFTPYPAQVRIRKYMLCEPLPEEQFEPIIAKNYYKPKFFWFELDKCQTKNLISLFSSKPVPERSSFTLFRNLSTSSSGQESDDFERSTWQFHHAGSDNFNMHSVSNWVPPGGSEHRFPPGPLSNMEEVKEHELNTNFGCSFASVVKRKSSSGRKNEFDSDVQLMNSNLSCHASETEIYFSQVPVNKEVWNKHDKEAMEPNNEHTYSSIVRNTYSLVQDKPHLDQSEEDWPVDNASGWNWENNLLPDGEDATRHAQPKVGQVESEEDWPVDNASGWNWENNLLPDATGEDATRHVQSKVRQIDSEEDWPLNNASGWDWENNLLPDATRHVHPKVEQKDSFIGRSYFSALSNDDESNSELETPSSSSRFEEKNLFCGASSTEEPKENLVKSSISWEPDCKIPSSSAITELDTSPLQGNEVKDSTSHATEEIKEFRTGATKENLSHMNASLVEDSTSLASEALANGDGEEMDGGKTKSSKLETGSHSSFSTEHANLEENNEESSLHSKDNSFSGGFVTESKFSDLQGVVVKLMREMEELKASYFQQSEKVTSLEEELVNSRKEIQFLREGYLTLQGHHSNLNESIYIVGGFDGSSWLSTLHSYSPTSDVMRSLSQMSSIRSYASAAKLNGELYILGGADGNGLWHDTVESYNPTKDQWVNCPPLNQRKGSLATASLYDKIFAIGGGNGVDCFSDVEMFDPDIGRWIPVRSMFEKRFAPAAAEINGTVYIVGGYNGIEYLKSAEKFDPRDHSWTRMQSMTTRRGCHSLAVLDEKLFAVGGYDGSNFVPTVEIFDPRMGLWMTGESLNHSRGYFAAVTIGHSIYVIGGLKEGQKIVDTVECYKEGSGWEVTDLKSVGKRCFFSAIVL